MLTADLAWAHKNFKLKVTFELAGPVTGIFGPSGAGKTTLLDLIAGLRRPTAGFIRLGDTVLFDSRQRISLPPEARHVGYVFQDHRLLPHLSVEANLLYGCRLRPRKLRRRRLRETAELLELSPLLRRWPSRLSGGERQRVALGRALLSEPKLLLFDEPLASLDVGLKAQILPFLRRVVTELSIPLLYVSHSLPEILELTTRVLVIEGGKLLAHGELFDVLGNEEVFGLVSSLGLDNPLEVQVIRADEENQVTVARLNGQDVILPFARHPPGRRLLVHLRPEDVVVSRQPVEGLSVQNSLRGRITEMVEIRDRVLLHVDVGQPLRVEVTHRAVEKLGLSKGVEVCCLAKTYSFRWGTVLSGA